MYADLLGFVRAACTHASHAGREIPALPFYVKEHAVGWLRPSFADRDLVAGALPFRETVFQTPCADAAPMERPDDIVCVHTEGPAAVRHDVLAPGNLIQALGGADRHWAE